MRNLAVIVSILLALIPATVGGQSKKLSDPLPRVLILGDSIYRQPATEATKAFKGKAEVVFPQIQPGEIRDTRSAIKNFDRFVGEKK